MSAGPRTVIMILIITTFIPVHLHGVKTKRLLVIFRVKTRTASKYGLPVQPRLVDIIAAVPQKYKKVSKTLYFEQIFTCEIFK